MHTCILRRTSTRARTSVGIIVPFVLCPRNQSGRDKDSERNMRTGCGMNADLQNWIPRLVRIFSAP